jgi:hypothetical protein
VIFNGVDSKDQALTAVRTMRYPPLRGAARREPIGIRGFSTAIASYAWGVSAAEYERRADLWPLKPDGDLLAVIMIESVEGLENLDQIAAVPGVGALFLGAGSDLSRSMGVPPSSPEVEGAFQQVLKACKAHKVACGITAGNANDIVRRVKEGWSIIRSTVPCDHAGPHAARRPLNSIWPRSRASPRRRLHPRRATKTLPATRRGRRVAHVAETPQAEDVPRMACSPAPITTTVGRIVFSRISPSWRFSAVTTRSPALLTSPRR